MEFNLNNETPWMTVLVLIIFVIIAVVGGIVVVANNMTYNDYCDNLLKLAGAAGLLGIGRGIAKKKEPTNVTVNNGKSE